MKKLVLCILIAIPAVGYAHPSHRYYGHSHAHSGWYHHGWHDCYHCRHHHARVTKRMSRLLTTEVAEKDTPQDVQNLMDFDTAQLAKKVAKRNTAEMPIPAFTYQLDTISIQELKENQFDRAGERLVVQVDMIRKIVQTASGTWTATAHSGGADIVMQIYGRAGYRRIKKAENGGGVTGVLRVKNRLASLEVR